MPNFVGVSAKTLLIKCVATGYFDGYYRNICSEKLSLMLKVSNLISTFKYAVPLCDTSDGSDEDSLRRLGKILHLSKSRSLIVKCDEPRFVKLGTKVCDSKLKEIGKVLDLFGPVTSPYVAVRPTTSSPAKFVHRIVYSFD